MRRSTVLLASFVAALALTGVAVAALTTNGGFETGDFTGWTHVNQAGGSGDWFVYSGATTPLNGFPFFAPPQGFYAAATDQPGPGSHVLYQDITLRNTPLCPQDRLAFTVYWNNQAAFSSPATLDYTVVPNQQFRVDIMRPGSPDFSVAPGDVLQNVLQTTPLSPAVQAPETISVPIPAAWKGTTVRLRFAEVDNQFYFAAGVDNVQYNLQKLCKVT